MDSAVARLTRVVDPPPDPPAVDWDALTGAIRSGILSDDHPSEKHTFEAFGTDAAA
jgi:hypothetical protein